MTPDENVYFNEHSCILLFHRSILLYVFKAELASHLEHTASKKRRAWKHILSQPLRLTGTASVPDMCSSADMCQRALTG